MVVNHPGVYFVLPKIRFSILAIAAGFAMNVSAGSAAVAETFEITVKNLTYAQIFSPPVAVAHSRRLRVFEAGEPAGSGLEILAEDGTPGPLVNELITAGADVAVNGDASPAPVLPGESATFRVTARGANRRISVVGMLITTNDAFFGLNSARTPERQSRTVRVVAYDAGTEVNDESCAHIPGPPCGNAGNEDGEPGEIGVPENGVVHIHRGIHSDTEGVNSVTAARDDWRNPVAEITIRRISPRYRY